MPGTAALDQSRWSRLWLRLGAQGDGLPLYQYLLAAYTAPTRAYHNAEHLSDCLAELDRNRELALRFDAVEAALWFHDAVYAPDRSDNESRSAELAESALRKGGVEVETCRQVADLVLATRHLAPAVDPDAQLISDIDLAILGSPPARFEEFERAIREEYGWVPDPVYRRERAKVLRGFLQRPTIYQTPAFIAKYEAPARENLEGLLRALAD